MVRNRFTGMEYSINAFWWNASSVLSKYYCLFERSSVTDRHNSGISKTVNIHPFLLVMFLNHLVTSFELCHWLNFILFPSSVFIVFKIYLPSLLFIGFSNLYLELVRKSGLWYFIAMKHFFIMMLSLSSRLNFLTIFFASISIFLVTMDLLFGRLLSHFHKAFSQGFSFWLIRSYVFCRLI